MNGVSTRSRANLVVALGGTRISKAEVCRGTFARPREEVGGVRTRRLDTTTYPDVVLGFHPTARARWRAGHLHKLILASYEGSSRDTERRRPFASW